MTQSMSRAMPLDEVIDRLAANDLVEGILIIGSAGRRALSPGSDYDLLVVLREQPLPVRTVITQIDGREAEIFFTTGAALDRIESTGRPVPNDSDDEILVHWIGTGQVVYDPLGCLSRAQQVFRSRNWVLLADETQRYATWFKLNNELRQILRLACGDDPFDHLAANLKLCNALHDLFVGYFLLRRIPWHGHKLALRYLAAQDPETLALWQALLAEPDLAQRIPRFVELARRTLAPVGTILDDAEVGVQFEPGTRVTANLLAAGNRFWDELLEGAYRAPWAGSGGEPWEPSTLASMS